MARFYPPGGGSSGSGGSSIDLDQITVPKRLVADGYKTITSDSIGEIVSGLLPKLDNASFGDTFDTSKITSATSDNTNGSFNFVLDGYFDDTEDNKSTTVTIPNCIPANIVSGIKVGGSNGYIQGTFSSDATATDKDIRKGKTAYVNGQLVTGTAIMKTATLTTGSDFVGKINITRALHFMRSIDPPVSGIVTEDISENLDRSVITWYDESSSTQYWYSDADMVYLNENSRGMFYMEGSSSTPIIETIDMSEFDTSKVTDMSFMFRSCWRMESLDISNFNTSNVTNMSYMFDACQSLTSLDLSNWNTTKVTNMSRMFSYCYALTSLDLSNFDTSNVTNMQFMFTNCQSLASLDLSNWDTSKVKFMTDMFSACIKLTSLDVSHFNTSNVIDMNSMFYNCLSLTSLDLSNFDTSKVTNMARMFSNCEKLSSPLDLSNFDTFNVLNMSYMFRNCLMLNSITYRDTFDINNTIYYSTFLDDDSNRLYQMFENCPANKPTDGYWDRGTWNDTGTFICTVTLTTGSNINDAINKSATQFVRSEEIPDLSITTTDISKYTDGTVITWYDEATTTQYWYSDIANVYMNSNSGNMFSGCSLLTSLDLSSFDTSKVTNMNQMFYNCSSLTLLNLSNFDTSNVSAMRGLFANCSSLTSLDLSNWNTSKVTDMYIMFHNCSSLTSIDLSNWNTSNVTSMRFMFQGCRLLTSLDVSHFDTSKVTDMDTMFYNCSKLTSLDLSRWNTSNVTNMDTMFCNCSGLTLLDLSNFNTSKVTNMNQMFYNCSSLTSLNVNNFNTSNVVNMYSMFYGCYSLTSLDVSNWNTSNVTNMSRMFKYCSKITNITYGSNFIIPDAIFDTCILDNNDNKTYNMYGECTANKPTDGNWDLGSWTEDTGTFLKAVILTTADEINRKINVNATSFAKAVLAPSDNIITESLSHDGDDSIITWYDESTITQYWYSNVQRIIMPSNCDYMFSDRTLLTYIDLSGWDSSKVTSMTGIFATCSSLTSLDLSEWNTSNVTSMSYMFSSCSSLTSLDLSSFDTSNVTDMNQMFYRCSSLTLLDVSNFNTSKVTSMRYLFNGCNSLTLLDISHWDTSKVTDMNSMFYNCSKLTSLDVSRWNTSSTINMNVMFCNCSGLTSLDVSHFDTSNVTSMSSMFHNCIGLTLLDVSNFNTSKVTTMSSMFSNCNSLTSLDLSNFDTSNVTSMSYMFSNCSSLTSLDLSSFDTSNVTDMSYMFQFCRSLTSLDVSSWNTSKVKYINAMFYDCRSLISLNLSNFDTSKITDMINVFSNCKALTSLDLSNWDTSNVTIMNNMFNENSKLTTIIYGNTFSLPDIIFDTCITAEYDNNYTYMMYYKCPANKPTGGNWDFGMWDSNGTFLKAAFMTDGRSFNNIINKEMTTFAISASAAPDGISTLDVSRDGDKSVVTWYDSANTTQYIYSIYDMIYLNTDSHIMFFDCSSLTSLDVSHFDTSKVTTMSWMFFNCSSLTSLDVSHFNTSNVTDMNLMFNSCSKLTSLDVSHFDTSKVTSMSSMFDKCSSLTSLDVSHFDISKVTSMNNMFDSCRGLTSLDVSHFDTSNVTSISAMFQGCSSLTSLDVSKWNTSKVTDMGAMFNGCKSLTSLDVSHFDTSKVTHTGMMFRLCEKLTSLDISNFDTSNVTNMNSMFENCSSLTSLDVSNFNTSNVTNMNIMFYNCSKLTSLDVSNFNTSKVTTMSNMFYYCSSLTSLNLSSFDTSNVTNMSYMFKYCSKITNITYGSNFIIPDAVYNTCMLDNNDNRTYNMYGGCTVNKPIGGNWDLGSWNNSGTFVINGYLTAGSNINTAINNSAMSFTRSVSAPPDGTTLTDISRDGDGSIVTWYDTSTTTQYWYSECMILSMNPDSGSMFWSKYRLTSLDLSGWNTSNVVNMYSMFNGCNSLTSIDLSGFDTSNVTNMENMFEECNSLISLDISNFDTSKVTDMSFMFHNCSSLTSLDLSNFSTSNVTNMENMFEGCISLTSLDLSNFDTSKVTSMMFMFSKCYGDGSFIIDYGNKFILPDALFDQCNTIDFLESGTNPTYWMFDYCSANRPIGGNWDFGFWDNDTTFVTAILKTGAEINSIIDKNATSFVRGTSIPSYTTGIKTTDITKYGNYSVVTWYDASTTTQYWYSDAKKVLMDPDSSGLFEGLTKATSINISDWYTHKVENMSMMFSKCQSLTSLDLSNFDTCSTTTLAGMFIQCTSLTTIIYSDKFILTSAIKDGSDSGMWGTTKGMFDYCPANKPTGGDWDLGTWVEQGSGIVGTAGYFSPASMIITGSVFNTIINKSATSLVNLRRAPDASIITTDISKDGDGSIVTWYDDTDNIQYWYSKYSHIYANPDSSNMFRNCNNMDQIYFEFDTSKVTNMSYMCSGCTNATTLDTSMCDTSNVTDMSYMFSGCTNATTISLIGADTSNVINMRGMFERCISLSKNMWVITLSDTVLNNCTSVDEANPTYHMYNECPVNKKPTGGNWDLGSWTADGTFIKN